MSDEPRPRNQSVPLIRLIQAEMQHATGKRYDVALEALNIGSLRELHRFLLDVQQEKQMAARRAQLNPWRRP